MVDQDLLETFRATMSDREYRREVLAEWPDDQGAYFTSEELVNATADYQLIHPEEAAGQLAIAGVDWGFSIDAHALLQRTSLVLLFARGRWSAAVGNGRPEDERRKFAHR